MSLLGPPLISYAELGMELPCSRDLWLANSAAEWKDLYLAKIAGQAEPAQGMTVRSCIEDCSAIFKRPRLIDVEFTMLAVIAAVWPLIWQYREIQALLKESSASSQKTRGMTKNARSQEMSELLQHIKMCAAEHVSDMRPSARLVHAQCLMHLWVSPQDVQMLAGKDGAAAARTALANFAAWRETKDARRALFYAGQIIKAARDSPDLRLQGASAVAVYHAGLTFWAYAVLCRRGYASRPGSPGLGQSATRPVLLDADESANVERYLVLGRGIPGIARHHSPVRMHETHINDDGSTYQSFVPLDDAKAVMTEVIGLLQTKFRIEGERRLSPMFENLINLLQALSKAVTGNTDG